jgi:hypothetical protein
LGDEILPFRDFYKSFFLQALLSVPLLSA